MTVLAPVLAIPMGRALEVGHPAGSPGKARWAGGFPAKASVSSMLPSAPSPLAAVGHLALDLKAVAKAGPVLRRQVLSLQAGMAELVLLNRLRARTRHVRQGLSQDTLERAARMIEVTARSWFGDDLAAAAAA